MRRNKSLGTDCSNENNLKNVPKGKSVNERNANAGFDTDFSDYLEVDLSEENKSPDASLEGMVVDSDENDTPDTIPSHQYGSMLEYYASVYDDHTKQLVRLKNRVGALGKNTRVGEWPREKEQVRVDIQVLFKDELQKDILKELKKYSDWKWMKTFPGIGPVNAAYILSSIDIEKADTYTSLLRYCGLSVTPTGERQKLVKGKTADYNSRLKRIMLHSIGQMTLLRKDSQYRHIYDTWCEKYRLAHPEWNKGHVHNAARRKVVKRFLLELWLRWRNEHGLSVESWGATRRNENMQCDAPTEGIKPRNENETYDIPSNLIEVTIQ